MTDDYAFGQLMHYAIDCLHQYYDKDEVAKARDRMRLAERNLRHKKPGRRRKAMREYRAAHIAYVLAGGGEMEWVT